MKSLPFQTHETLLASKRTAEAQVCTLKRETLCCKQHLNSHINPSFIPLSILSFTSLSAAPLLVSLPSSVTGFAEHMCAFLPRDYIVSGDTTGTVDEVIHLSVSFIPRFKSLLFSLRLPAQTIGVSHTSSGTYPPLQHVKAAGRKNAP